MKNFLYIVWLMAISMISAQQTNAQTPAIETKEVRTICSGDSLVIDYQDQHLVITQTTTYGFQFNTVDPVSGETVDSIHWLIVNVAPKYIYKEIYYLPTGGSYLWHGQTITQAGTYIDEKESISGCNTVYELVVTENEVPCQPRYGEVQHLEICPNEQHTWQGKTISAAGTYTDIIRTQDGCDSILTLVVNILPSDTIHIKKTIQRSELPYIWEGKECKTEGTYRESFVNQRGCDSTRILHLTLLPQVDYSSESLTICEGDTIILGKLKIAKGGLYTDTLTNRFGGDSIVRYQVTMKPARHNIQRIQLMSGETTVWHGQTINKAGTYHYTEQPTDDNDCPILHELIVTVAYDFVETESVRICENDLPYRWRGLELTQSGTWRAPGPGNGAENYYEIQLEVLKRTYEDIEYVTCVNDSVQINGKKYAPGVYTDTLVNAQGCDSIRRIVIRAAQSDTIHTYANISDQQEYIWPIDPTKIYTNSGTYYKEFKNQYECDSVHVLHLNVWPTYHIDTTATVCQTDLPYLFHGRAFNRAGIYEDRYETIHGYDSVYTLTLHVNPVKEEIKTIHLCQGNTYLFNGKMIDHAGEYRDTLTSLEYGCDSIIILRVEEAQRYLIEEKQQISDQESYFWPINQQTYTTGGMYYAYFQSKVSGCDSTHVLNLSVYPTYHIDTVAEVCQTDLPFEWHGMQFSNSGTFYDRYTSIHGYDSIYTLNLTIIQVEIEEVTLKLCKGDTIYYNGKMYTTGGIYQDADNCAKVYRIIVSEYIPREYRTVAWLHGSQTYYWKYGKENELQKTFNQPGVYKERILDPESNCYDVYILDLRQGDSFFSEEEYTICEGEPFVWRGKDLSHANVGTTTVYYDSLQTVLGNDSIYKLTLTVGKKYLINQALTVCKGGTITWNGQTYKAGVYTDTLHTILGCDSVVRTVVTEANTYYIEENATITAGESLMWNGMRISKEGDFYHYGRTAAGCDSTIVLHVTVIPAAPENWLITDEATICQGEKYHWRGRDFMTSGTYYDSLKCEYPPQLGKDSVYMLKLTVYPKYEKTQHLYTCNEGTIRYNGVTYTKDDEGTPHEIHLTTIHGCDSMITLYVHFNDMFESFDTLHLNNQEQFTWQGQIITASGDYTVRYEGQHGCDSVYHLHAIMENKYVFVTDTAMCETEAPFEWRGITIPRRVGTYNYEDKYLAMINGEEKEVIQRLNVTMWPVYEAHKQLNICDGSQVSYYGQVFDQPGDFDIVVKTIGNCDSIIHVHVNQVPSYHHVTEAFINTYKKGTYTWMGKTYNEAGTYTIQTQNEFGCEQIDQLVLKELPVKQDTQVICYNELPFVWRGHSYNHSCDVEEFERDEHNVDTAMYTLHLEVRPQYESYKRKDMCMGQSIHINGADYTTTANDVTEQLKTVEGCDSIIHWEIVFHEPFHSSETRYLRPGNQFEWHGMTITEPGYYTDHHENIWGCDSTYDLRVLKLEVILTEAVICEADTPYIWNNRKYYENSEDYIQIQDINGLDSAEYRLILAVNPQERDTIQEVLCYGEQYPYAGKIWSGNVDTILYVPQPNGCNKIVHLMLHEIQPYSYDSVVYLRDWQKLEWHNKTLPQNNIYKTYYDTVYSTKGCDSIYYSMDVRRMDSIAHDTMVCKYDMPFYWDYDGNTYDKTSTIDYIEQDQLGRDSVIHTLNLTVLDVFDTTIVAKICDNQLPFRYIIPGHVFEHDSTGIYHDTIPSTKYGVCDSIYNFILTVYPTHEEYKADTICENQLPYVVAGQKFWNEGQYHIQTQTQECGCDSIIDLRLVIRPTMTKNDSVVMCKEDLPYYLGDTLGVKNRHADSEYHGLPFYTDTIVWDCDHTHYFHVIVRDPIPVDDIFFCEGDSVSFGFHNDGTRRWIYETGVYYDTISSHESFSQTPDHIRCDSILRVNAYRLTRDTVHKTAHILSDSTYEFYGQMLEMPGIYYAEDTVTLDWTGTDMTKRRCNDMIELTLIVDTVYRFRDSIHVCMPVDSFYYHQWPGGHWQGDDGYLGPDGQKKKLKIQHSGVYTDSLRRETTRLSTDNYYKNFKDSIYTLVVTMDTAYITYQIYDLCKGDSVLFNEQWITKEGIYRDTLTTTKGCDSIVQLVVNYIPSYQITEKDVRISDKMLPYIWTTKDHLGQYKHQLLNSGLYTDTLKTIRGCDSIVTLRLEVAPSYYIEDTTHVCSTYNGEEHHYRFADGHEFTFSYSGDYYDTLRTIHADPTWPADSIYHLNVVAHFSPRNRIDTTICRDDSVLFNGQYIYHEGIYYDTLATMPRDQYDTCHCDSIIEWNVHFAEHYYVDEGLHYIAKGDNYLWHWQHSDTILRTEGIYYDRMESMFGCDSVFRIEIKYAPTYLLEERDEVCQNNLPYRWHGTDLYQTGTYYDSLQTYLGFDSIYVLNLLVFDSAHAYINLNACEGDSLYYNGRWLKEQGEYVDTLKTSLHGCDSILHISFQIFPKFRKIEDKIISDKMVPYHWHGKELSNSGIYYDSLQSVNACDSIIELHLTVGQTYFFEDNITVCQSELPYTWSYQGHVLHTYDHNNLSGTLGEVRTLKDSIYYQTVLGFDSIYAINLSVLPTVYGDTLLGICEGDSVYVHGRYISVPGNYTDTLVSTQFGCDSIVRVKVTMINREHSYVNISLCQDEQFTLRNGEIVTTDGIYTDTLKSFVTGCDSVVHYTIHFVERHVNEYTYEINDKQTYEFFGEILNQPKTYTHIEKSVNGCDSLVTILHLVVWQSVSFDSIATICQDETSIWQGYSVNFAGRTLDQPLDTLFTREYTTIHGADSIYRLHLKVMPMYRTNYTITLCEGESTVYNGVTYGRQGTYYDTLRSQLGCDSIVAVHVQELPSYHFHETAHTSDKVPYLWHGRELRFTGTYYDSLATSTGCDSIYVLHLTVYPTYDIDTVITVCSSELPYKLFDRSYSKAGQYLDTLQTVMNYDSVYHIDLRVLETAEGHLYVQRCDGESLIYNGHTYPVAGYYQDTIRALNGCDSIVHIHFSQIKTQHYYDSTSICSNETYYWAERNRTLKFAGVYHDTIKAKGSYCDSVIYEMRLNVVPTFHGDTTIIMCRDEGSLRFGTRDYYETGTYVDTMQSVTGCDSIWTLHLKVNDWNVIYIDTMLCENDVFVINGTTITEDRRYRDTVALGGVNGNEKEKYCGTIIDYNIHYHHAQHVHFHATVPANESYTWRYGDKTKLVTFAGDYTDTIRYAKSQCDSIVFHLHLTTIPIYESIKDTTVCSNDLPFMWNNRSYLRDTTFNDTVRTDTAHYYTKVILHVHESFYQELNYDLCYGNVFGINGQKYTRDTVFFDTIPTTYGCDSVTKYTIRVFPVMEHWDTVHIDEKKTYEWHGRVLNETGSYVAYENTDHGCEDIYHLYLKTHPSYYFLDSVDLCDNEKETLRWYGHGMIIARDSNNNPIVDSHGDTLRYMETPTTDIYFDKHFTVEGYDSIYEHRVYVHPSYFKRETYNINFGQTLTLHGKKYTEPGVYLDKMYTIYGCDSTFNIVINNPRVMEYEEYESTCENALPFRYEINDTVYLWTKPGLYTVVFDNEVTKSQEIHKVHLTIYRPDVIKTTALVADDKLPYFHGGRRYNLTDDNKTVIFDGYNIHGCDSTNEFTFHVCHRYNSLPDTMYFCRGDYVVVNEDTIYEPGTFDIPTMRYNKVTDHYDIDSLHRVRYEYGPTYERDMNVDLTQGESIKIGDHTYSKEGRDTIHLKTMYGCDSTIYLNIRLVPKVVVDERVIEICAGETYLWHRGNIWPDTTLTVPGYYYRDAIIGLNSYHFSVNLSVKNPVNIQNITIPNTCADADQFEIELNHGGTIDSYSILFDADGKRAGFQDVVDEPYTGEPSIMVKMPKTNKTYFDGTNYHSGYVTPGDYDIRIQVNNAPCLNTEARGTLHVLYPAWIMQQNWQDVVAVLDSEHNGGFEFKSFWWSLNGMSLTNSTPYLYYPGGFTVGDKVGLRVSLYSGGTGIAVCEPLVIERYVNNDPDEHPYMTPKAVARTSPRVQLKASDNGSYRIFSSEGRLIEEGAYEPGEQTLTMPDASGCYIVRTQSQHGRVWTEKIIVY